MSHPMRVKSARSSEMHEILVDLASPVIPLQGHRFQVAHISSCGFGAERFCPRRPIVSSGLSSDASTEWQEARVSKSLACRANANAPIACFLVFPSSNFPMAASQLPARPIARWAYDPMVIQRRSLQTAVTEARLYARPFGLSTSHGPRTVTHGYC